MSLRNVLGQDIGGAKQMRSARTKAQIAGIECFMQVPGFERRHPTVCVAVSPACNGM